MRKNEVGKDGKNCKTIPPRMFGISEGKLLETLEKTLGGGTQQFKRPYKRSGPDWQSNIQEVKANNKGGGKH